MTLDDKPRADPLKDFIHFTRLGIAWGNIPIHSTIMQKIAKNISIYVTIMGIAKETILIHFLII